MITLQQDQTAPMKMLKVLHAALLIPDLRPAWAFKTVQQGSLVQTLARFPICSL